MYVEKLKSVHVLGGPEIHTGPRQQLDYIACSNTQEHGKPILASRPKGRDRRDGDPRFARPGSTALKRRKKITYFKLVQIQKSSRSTCRLITVITIYLT